jgi:hypothetical protein
VFRWNRQVESVRKGIERVNGVVKGRFRLFMLPIMLQDSEVVDDLFCFACALHNWRLNVDGLDTFWDSAEHWRLSRHETAETLEEGEGKGSTLSFVMGKKKVLVKETDDFSTSGTASFGSTVMLHSSSATAEGSNVSVEEVDDDFFLFRKRLVDHYAYVSTTSNPEHKLQKKLTYRSFTESYRRWWADNANKEDDDE